MNYEALRVRLADLENLTKFAEQSGIPRRTLQRLRQGTTNPSLAMLDNVAAKLREIKPKRRAK